MTHSRSSVRFRAVALMAVLLAGCRSAPSSPSGGGLIFAGPGWFEDATDQIGLDFVRDAGPTDGSYFMPQSLGSGAALFDFNNDGLLSRGLCVGDVFNDGSLALLTTEIGGPARLYRNVAPDHGHWLEVRAIDPALRRDAYGAEVIVRAGGKKWARWINPAGSFLCSNDPRAHFGLGKADKVDSVEILWPDGRKEAFDGGPADEPRVLRRGEGRIVEKRR